MPVNSDMKTFASSPKQKTYSKIVGRKKIKFLKIYKRSKEPNFLLVDLIISIAPIHNKPSKLTY